MISYLLFDLDGTISDPKEGITTCVQYALKSLGIEESDLKKLEAFIGPPLKDSLEKFYDITGEQADLAIEKYRERFSRVGKFENVLYPGMSQLLRELKTKGFHLAVASSKPTVFVEDILKYFGIRDCFEVVVGSELDGTRVKKAEVVAEVLRQFFGDNTDVSQVAMIGDRCFDVEGARALGTYSIAVSFGYAQPGELEAAGPDEMAHSVEELRMILLSKMSQAMPAGLPFERGQNEAAEEILQTEPAPVKKKLKDRIKDRIKNFFKEIGTGLLAMIVYYAAMLVGVLIVELVYFIKEFIQGNRSMEMPNEVLAVANAVGIGLALIICFIIWRKKPNWKSVKKLDKSSILPFIIAACTLAAGMNGVINLTELYKYSPTFQQLAEFQLDVPILVGILMYGILAPFGEELVMRGVVYGSFRKVMPKYIAMLFSGILFGIYHGNLVQAVYASVLGFVLAYVYEIYGTLWASIIFHSLANLFTYMMMDVAGLGELITAPISCVLFMVISIVAMAMVFKWQHWDQREKKH